jgi:hypothetical protein
MNRKEKIAEAIKAYGREVVSMVLTMVSVGDADGCYTQFEDEGMYEHAECVEFIYFDD